MRISAEGLSGSNPGGGLLSAGNRSAPTFDALLAPIGAGSREPDSLPLISMHDFKLVRRKDAQVRVAIAGQERPVDLLTFFFPGPRAYLSARGSGASEPSVAGQGRRVSPGFRRPPL